MERTCRAGVPVLLAICLGAVVFLSPGTCLANHPVLVEGESDFDGDGLIGTDEDDDGDRVFGTIGAALAAPNGAANQNGRVTIVTSGRFPEGILITGENGNVTVEAAPGVEANVDAVVAGVPGNVERQNAPGVVVDAPNNRSIILRNLVIRNWRDGIIVRGDSHVMIDNCRVEQNLNFGILAQGQARVVILHTDVTGTGFRVGVAGNSPDVDLPAPGAGIHFENHARGVVASSSSTGNFGPGLAGGGVQRRNTTLFDNNRSQRSPDPGGDDDDDDD